MIYLDNAATSRFKPKSVLDAINFDILHSANSGRSGHDEAIGASMRINACREYLKQVLGADDEYEVIFTKSCTEALNLAIFGSLQQNDRVVTSQNEHNSVLRPLFRLKEQGKISLTILNLDENGKINLNELREIAKDSDVFVFGGASNITGATANVYEIGKIAKEHGIRFIVDGAQSVPICPLNIKEYNVDMLACPAHKGLHGIQGCGFLLVKRDIPLIPLIYGGTGAFSQDLSPALQMPESYEAGTQFSGGISALHYGAEWSYKNLNNTRKNLIRLTKNAIYNLKQLNATLYTREYDCGIISFNIADIDSGYIADFLNELGVCVRGGLHCAPLVHKHLNTLEQGAVRVSFGCDSQDSDLLYFSKAMEHIVTTLSKR